MKILILTIVFVITLSACVHSPRKTYQDPVIAKRNSDFLAFKQTVSDEAAQGIITQEQSEKMITRKFMETALLIEMRKLELIDPKLPRLFLDEFEYRKKLDGLKKQGKISELEYEDRIIESQNRWEENLQKRIEFKNLQRMELTQLLAQMAANRRSSVHSSYNQPITSVFPSPFPSKRLNCTSYKNGNLVQTSCD